MSIASIAQAPREDAREKEKIAPIVQFPQEDARVQESIIDKLRSAEEEYRKARSAHTRFPLEFPKLRVSAAIAKKEELIADLIKQRAEKEEITNASANLRDEIRIGFSL